MPKVLKLIGSERSQLHPVVFGGEAPWVYRALTPVGEVLAPEVDRNLGCKVFSLGPNEQGRPAFITEARVGPIHYREHGLVSADPWRDVSTDPRNILGLFEVQYPTADYPAFAYRSRDGGDWILVELLGVPAKYDWAARIDSADRRTWKDVWPGVDVELRVWPDRLGLFKVIKSPLAQHSFTFRVLGERDGKLVKPERIVTRTGEITDKTAIDIAYRDGVSEAKLLIYDKVRVIDLQAWNAQGKTIATTVWGYKDGTRTESIPVQPASAYPLTVDTDVTEQVEATADDGWHIGTPLNTLGTTFMRFGNSGGAPYNCFSRWATVVVDQAATIGDGAVVRYKANETNSTDTCKSNLFLNAADSAVAPTAAAEYAGKALTDPIAWNPAAWTANATYDSPSITALLQAVVNRQGFQSGNAVMAMQKDNGSDMNAGRRPYDYTDAAASAPWLLFAWSAGAEAKSGTVAISGGGAVAATGKKAALHTITLSGGGSVSATGAKATSGTASVSGGGDLDLAGKKGAFGTVTVSGGGGVSAEGIAFEGEQYYGAAQLSGGGSIIVLGAKAVLGVAEVSGGGTIAAQGIKAASGAAPISGGGFVTATGTTLLGQTELQRKVGEGEWLPLDIVDDPATSYDDEGPLQDGATYYYRARRRVKTGEPSAPLLVAEQVGSIIRLTWGDA